MNDRMGARIIVSTMALALVAVAFSFSAPNAEAMWGYSWSTETAMGSPASQAVVVNAANGTIYIMGGVTDSTYAAVTDAYSYDPDSGDWTVLSSMTSPTRGAAGAMGLDGKVYVFSGAYSGLLSDTQIYDPATDSWSAGADVPVPVWEAKAATVGNGSIWVVGGEGASAGLVQIYDPVADTWSVGPTAPVAVLAGALVADGNDLYYSGGGAGYAATSNFMKYDATLGNWTPLADMLSDRAAHAMVLGVDGLIYVMGGGLTAYNVESGFDTVDAYDPETNAWSNAESMDVARTYLGATMTPDGQIFAVGGNDDSTILDDMESLQLYLVDFVVSLSSSSVRAGEPVLMTYDPQLEFAEEYYSDISWYLTSDADGTVFLEDYNWNPTPNPMAISLDVPLLAVPGEYTVVIEYMEVWGNTVYDYVEMIEMPLTVLPAATPTEDLISDLEDQITALEDQIASLESQIAALESNLSDLADAMDTADAELMAQIDALQTQVSDLEDALAALETSVSSDNQDLMDEITALQEQMAQLQDSLDNVSAEVAADDTDNTMNYVVIVLVIIVILLLVVMMLMRPKSVPPPP